MVELKFVHTISKGSRYNQIYVPKDKEGEFEVGDSVEIRLLRKKEQLHYSKNLPKLSEFKKRLIKEIFGFLSENKEIKQIFVFGSFLTKDVDYRDIDIILISEREIEEQIYNSLIKKFSLKFHVISIPEKNLEESLKTSPMTRSMLYYFVSNRHFQVSNETKIEKNQILYLLMMPEDLLELELDGYVFYSNIRKLITIEIFLEGKDADPEKISFLLKKIVKEPLLSSIENNEPLEKQDIKELREIIKKKLKSIKSKL